MPAMKAEIKKAGPAGRVSLLAACKRRGVSPRLMINQATVELVLEAAGRGDRNALADHIAERMGELRRAGADLLAIAAVTPHLCMPELIRRMPDDRITDASPDRPCSRPLCHHRATRAGRRRCSD